jgi:hypothetical protein
MSWGYLDNIIETKLIKLYQAGYSLKALHEKFNLSIGRISRILKRNNIITRHGPALREFSRDSISEMKSLYSSGECISNIATQFCTSTPKIRELLTNEGISIVLGTYDHVPPEVAEIRQRLLKEPNGTQICLKCYEVKPLLEFRVDKRKNKRPKIRGICQVCDNRISHHKARKRVWLSLGVPEHIADLRNQLTESPNGKQVCLQCYQVKPIDNFKPFATSYECYSRYCDDCSQTRKSLIGRSRRRLLTRQAIIYKGGKCECCGQVFPDASFDFHHRYPLDKDFAISEGIGKGMSWITLKPEIDKCQLLCANCHRILTAESYDNKCILIATKNNDFLKPYLKGLVPETLLELRKILLL